MHTGLYAVRCRHRAGARSRPRSLKALTAPSFGFSRRGLCLRRFFLSHLLRWRTALPLDELAARKRRMQPASALRALCGGPSMHSSERSGTSQEQTRTDQFDKARNNRLLYLTGRYARLVR